MLSEEQLKAAYNGCKEGGHLGALAAVAEAAVRDERENRNRPMALREFAELVQKLVIIGPLTSEQGRQLMMLQEMASTTLEAAVKDAVGGDEPEAYVMGEEIYWHDAPDINDHIRKYGTPLYTRPQASAAVPEDKWKPLLEAVMREMPRQRPSQFDIGNGPGHGHQVKGIWDSDNGDLAGKPCAWCLAWDIAKSSLAASQPEVRNV